MIIVGKSMPIDHYEQYKRVIKQITGRLYMHIYIYIRNQEIVWFWIIIFLVCVWLFITVCFWSIYKVVLKLVSELHDFIWFGMVFHKDAPENEKLVLKRSILGLGRVLYLDVAQMLEKIKSCLRYGGARFLYALNTNTTLLNISFSLSGSIPKYRSFVSVDKEESDIINFAALLWR